MSLVGLVRVNNSDTSSLEEAIDQALNLIHLNPERARDAEKIVIKPNLCYYYHPSTGDITDPLFIGALIDVLRRRLSSDPEILLVESDASAMKCKYAFPMLGYEEMAGEKGVKLINLSEERSRLFEVNVNGWYLRFRIPEVLRESDLLVNVPKLKYMGDAKITCALKNIYGCNAFRKKSIYHVALEEAIVGINRLVKSNLVVADGIMVCGRATRRLGLVMASADPVALDSAASRIMGIDPASVKQILLASKMGLGSMDFIPVGESLSYFEALFPRMRAVDRTRRFLSSLYLRVFSDKL